MSFVPPPRRPKTPPQPIILTDDKVKAIFAAEPVTLKDGPFPVFGSVIGWKYTNSGALGAVVVNQVTGNRFLYGVDFQTGKPRHLGKLPAPTR